MLKNITGYGYVFIGVIVLATLAGIVSDSLLARGALVLIAIAGTGLGSYSLARLQTLKSINNNLNQQFESMIAELKAAAEESQIPTDLPKRDTNLPMA